MRVMGNIKCVVCNKVHQLTIPATKMEEYYAGLALREEGMPIQEALPFLNNKQLELIISGLCDKAFEEINNVAC
jgi:hypothetical protein